ncbi:Metal tolerance protein 2 [Platanthera zijinensis]|uniref:Metal tolerance protein 2 n=1 Tax=Platanthera zijinensis TaxID=2320716 RepID=A0AAP0AXA1_9ASPA
MGFTKKWYNEQGRCLETLKNDGEARQSRQRGWKMGLPSLGESPTTVLDWDGSWHGKFESLGALGISCMLLGTGGGIAWHAFDVLQGLLTSTPDIISNTLDSDHNHNHGHGGHHHGFDLDHPVLALSMTSLSISVKEGLYWVTKRAGEKQGSGLMKANAWHHRTDAVSSIVALVGVVSLGLVQLSAKSIVKLL